MKLQRYTMYFNDRMCYSEDVKKLEQLNAEMLSHLRGMKTRFIVHGQGDIDFEIELLKSIIRKAEAMNEKESQQDQDNLFE